MLKTKTRKTRSSASTDDPRDRATRYARDVVAGRLIAGPHVRNACRRHLDDLVQGPDRGLRWDLDAALHVWTWFETVLKLSEGQFEGKPLELHASQAFMLGSLFGWRRRDGTRRFRRAYIEQGKGNGKALALDTPIPTPSGWTTMGQLQPGDELFDERGRVCQVLQVHPVSTDRECFEVEFDDGETIVASAEHLWRTEMRRHSDTKAPRATKGVPKAQWGNWRTAIRTTAEIAETLTYPNGKHQSANHSIAPTAPLRLPEADLPIPPYALGVWLGDGDSDCARFTCAFADEQIVQEVMATGEPVRAQRRHSETTGRFALSAGRGAEQRRNSFAVRLRSLGLMPEKFIPPQYLRGSPQQRQALLQGLMDTDGTIDRKASCEFTSTNERLALDVRELVISLGMKATLQRSRATLRGRDVGPKFRLVFSPPWDLPVFRLDRKSQRQQQTHDRRRLSADRRIVACRRIDPVPVRCITVSSPSSLFLCGRAMVPTHNSPIAGGIGLYGMTADGEAGAQIYAAAAKKDQADIMFRDAVKMVKKSPALTKRLQFSGGEGREWNIAHIPSASFFRPISRSAGTTGSGPRPHFALCDEVHEHPDRLIMELLERGFKFRRNPLLFMITNSGHDRNSVCWEEHEHAVRVAAGTQTPDAEFAYVGEVIDDTTFSYVCALDPGDDPFEDPSCWVKANPLLGVTITEDYLAGVVAQAKAMPGKANQILRLHFCVWTDAEQAWISRAALEAVLDEFDPDDVEGQACAGIDLSGNRDMTAAAFIVEDGQRDGKPSYAAWVDAWTPEETLRERAREDRAPYDVWVQQGHLQTTPGKFIRMEYPAAAVADVHAARGIKLIAYDRYAYRKFEEELDALGCEVEQIEHPQGGKRRGKVPDSLAEEAKTEGREAPEGLWMPGSLKMLEELILDGRIRIKTSPVIISASMSAAIEEDPFGNRWLSKRKATQRIDALIALAMAVGAITMGEKTEAAGWKGFLEV